MPSPSLCENRLDAPKHCAGKSKPAQAGRVLQKVSTLLIHVCSSSLQKYSSGRTRTTQLRFGLPTKPQPWPACWGVSVACQEPAAGALISGNQQYGGPPPAPPRVG